MTGLRRWGPSLALLALAAAAGLLAGGGGGSADSPVPSVRNPGALGLEVLRVWLEESGARVHALDGPYTALPEGVATVVVPSPAERPVGEDEVRALRAFVEAGGTLLWLAGPGTLKAQPALAGWLRVSRGPPLRASGPVSLDDPTGRSAPVAVPVGLAAGLRALRVGAGPAVQVDGDAVPVADGGALWALRQGRGEVWIAAGPDLAEARRLELEDNAAFWSNLAARGPLAFGEWHHVPPEGPALTANLRAAAFQLPLLALALLLVFGRRLGPPRPEPRTVHRSSREYVDALAGLTRRAHLEADLASALHRRIRRVLHERCGLSVQLPDEEASRALERDLPGAGARVSALLHALAAPPRPLAPAQFVHLAKDAARLELVLEGRAPPGVSFP